jgi:very-short-patch-repair endonuclease
MTDRRIARIDPSYLHVCHAVTTDVAAQGLDPSHLHPDRLIGLVASRQHGVILREQLAALGLGRGAIAHRRRRGLLHPLHDGAYVWGDGTATPEARALAAVAVSGQTAVVSHTWALALWQLCPPVHGPVDVTGDRRARSEGVRGHESPRLHPADVRRVRGGIPITTPARSLLDSAPQLTPRELADAVELAQVKRLVTKRDIAATLDRTPRRRGAPALRALLDEPAFTRSRAERRLVRLLRAARLPAPVFNAVVEGREVDALWQRERVVLEFDSYTFHASRAAFERDRRKGAALTRERYVVLRTTWRELTEQSHFLVARTAEALARGGP